MGGRGARNPRRAPNGGGKRLGEARRRGKTRGKGGCDPPRSSCPSPPRCRLARPPAPALLLSRPPPPPPRRRARTRAGPRRGRGAGAEGEDNKDILHIHSCWGGGARRGAGGRPGPGGRGLGGAWRGNGGGGEHNAGEAAGPERTPAAGQPHASSPRERAGAGGRFPPRGAARRAAGGAPVESALPAPEPRRRRTGVRAGLSPGVTDSGTSAAPHLSPV